MRVIVAFQREEEPGSQASARLDRSARPGRGLQLAKRGQQAAGVARYARAYLGRGLGLTVNEPVPIGAAKLLQFPVQLHTKPGRKLHLAPILQDREVWLAKWPKVVFLGHGRSPGRYAGGPRSLFPFFSALGAMLCNPRRLGNESRQVGCPPP